MFRKKKQIEKKLLDGCCTKDQQIEMYRTLYAKAAKERDEAVALAKTANKQSDALLAIAKEAVQLADSINKQHIELVGLVRSKF